MCKSIIQSTEVIKNNQRIGAYKLKAQVSNIEAYSYIKRRLCNLWKTLGREELIHELEELLPFMNERAKAEVRMLIGIAKIRESDPMKPCHCKICKGEFWIPKDREVHVLGMTCCDECEEQYQEMRSDGHWR